MELFRRGMPCAGRVDKAARRMVGSDLSAMVSQISWTAFATLAPSEGVKRDSTDHFATRHTRQRVIHPASRVIFGAGWAFTQGDATEIRLSTTPSVFRVITAVPRTSTLLVCATKTHLHSVETAESHVFQESTSRRPAAIKVTRIWDARNVCRSVR